MVNHLARSNTDEQGSVFVGTRRHIVGCADAYGRRYGNHPKMGTEARFAALENGNADRMGMLTRLLTA